ncbi:cation:proton antiporter regulatory subunit [Planosporangium flavigriseum]|uniref:Potassium transporter TrkA n=1 Tax=Planosporangium flavigriseum TaxID=373681 RepID=A0A8J3PPX5_9ACTN|nr:cation:proton antiporter regulatory subunit [Planosporangium flavigriseum]NJC67918.1 cation:proton antiporter regulatory subunit [Planosporangium flavigriseum]GIG76819.1 potassium transporter TrkA [Planosporangium flavigriseum]
MDVERTPLPGIGLRHVFVTHRGRRLGVVSHRDGRRDLVVYRRDDPDSAAETLVLTPEEANGLAELLGAARIVERLAELHRQVEGLVSEQIPITAGSPYDGRSLGDTRTRARTGASVVAVVRDREVIASPRPDFVFHAGDVVVAVGTAEGTAAVATILTDG